MQETLENELGNLSKQNSASALISLPLGINFLSSISVCFTSYCMFYGNAW